MREEELAQLEQHVRALEETNLNINEKLNAAHLSDATAFTYDKEFSEFPPFLSLSFIGIHS